MTAPTCFVCLTEPATSLVVITALNDEITRYVVCPEHEPRHIPQGSTMVIRITPVDEHQAPAGCTCPCTHQGGCLTCGCTCDGPNPARCPCCGARDLTSTEPGA